MGNIDFTRREFLAGAAAFAGGLRLRADAGVEAKAGGYNAGSFEVNYVRWKIGGVYPPDNRPGMLIRVR